MFGSISGAWRFRHFIASSVRAEFANRFARSRLGGLWMILNPLAQAAMFAFVLATVLSARLPGLDSRYGFAMFLMAGLLAWSLFVETINRCLTVFIDNASLLKKMSFPRICLPLVVAGSALIGNLLLLLAIILVFALLGEFPGPHALWLVLLIPLTLALGLGLGLTLGVLNVFLRDIGQVMPIVLQFAFWFTPIVYAPSLIPPGIRPLLMANPMFPVVTAYQDALVYGRAPQFVPIAAVAIAALALLALAMFLFRRAGAEMVDAL